MFKPSRNRDLRNAMMGFCERARRNVNLTDFQSASKPIDCGTWVQNCITYPDVEELRVLRMLVKTPDSQLLLPPQLGWIRPTMEELFQNQYSNDLPTNGYVYVTVRHGLTNTVTDDVWHVDGFSMRTPHTPEQNYVWCSDYPTQFLINAWNIPTTFDPLRHNIHRFFQMYQEGASLLQSKPNTVYLVDPYCVHRRDPASNGVRRTFVRVSFVPIEIEDDTCTQNPRMPVKHYGREDIRKRLTDWTPTP